MYIATSDAMGERKRLEREHHRQIAEQERREKESAAASPPMKLLHELEIRKTTYLDPGDSEGWVTLDGHRVFIRWSKYYPIPVAKAYKQNIEKVVAEAAIMKCQTEVEIR